jgi:hypothetical protein
MCEISTTRVSMGQSWNAHGSSGFAGGSAALGPVGTCEGVPARLDEGPGPAVALAGSA